MKYLFFISLTIIVVGLFSCEENHMHEDNKTDYQYHAHINSPNSETKKLNDELIMDILFESHSGETVHHISILIYEKDDTSNVVYNKPNVPHVHSEKEYHFLDTFILSEENGFTAHSNWVLEAQVWGHEAGEGKEIETIEFHVHPE